MKSLKRMLKAQELVVGLTIEQACDPWIAKVYADAGSDFVFIENEHLLFSGKELANLVLSCHLCGMPVVAKCEYVDRGSVTKLLDAGVTGIQLTMLEEASQVARVAGYTKFPPEGVRAAAPGSGNTDYEQVPVRDWLEEANRETVVIAHIETKAGVEKIDEILAVPHVDVMFVGTLDLSVSLGHPAEFEHPDMVRAMDRLIGAAKEHGKTPGMGASCYEHAEPWIKKGMCFVETMGDVGFVRKGAVELVKRFPGHGPRSGSADGRA